MSHDRSRRAACFTTKPDRCFHSSFHTSARGVTAVGVGSGALLGAWEHATTAEKKCRAIMEEIAAQRSKYQSSPPRTLRADRTTFGNELGAESWPRPLPRRFRQLLLSSSTASHRHERWTELHPCPLFRRFLGYCSPMHASPLVYIFLPNVKDEPRPQLARRVPHSILESTASFRTSFP
jgi:hypothetical protein